MTAVLNAGQAEQEQPSQGHSQHGECSDAATKELLEGLRGSRTDLIKLVTRVHRGRRQFVAVSPHAVARWLRDAPGTWERVHEWLITRGVTVIYL